MRLLKDLWKELLWSPKSYLCTMYRLPPWVKYAWLAKDSWRSRIHVLLEWAKCKRAPWIQSVLCCEELSCEQAFHKCINDRLMTLPLPNAPIMTKPEEVREWFYEDLNKLTRSAPRQKKLLRLGDINARDGSDLTTWEGVRGQNGVGKCNTNGLVLLRSCAEHEHAHRNRTPWMHQRSRH